MRQIPALSVLLVGSAANITASNAQAQSAFSSAPPTDFGIREVGTTQAITDKAGDELGTFSTIQISLGFGAATAINAAGDIGGNYADENGNGGGFILRNGVAASINYPAAADTAVFGMNDAGDLVGFYSVEGNNSVFGFLFKKGGYSSVSYPGATVTHALGVNDLASGVRLIGAGVIN